ncbi:uncharacterized protein [Chironomus tepperi]|uniref:uncharacterized protein n=1 Tax=Chironomus tepperi TaxID=113505 RepID=UPI00391EE525
MTQIITIICVLITLISVTSADTATCQYTNKSFKIHKNPVSKYTCELSLGNPNKFISVTDINGNHNRRTDNDVKFLILNKNSKLEEFSSIFCTKFPNLEAIKFENVKINEIDAESLQGCENLMLFHLKNNDIHEIPENLFSENQKLVDIMITSNQVTSLEQDTFEMQENLKILNLKNNKINSLPDKIFVALSNLETLVLDNNQLADLNPRWFKELENLSQLSIGSNRITDLPEGVFGNLINLVGLNLESNSLTVIQSSSFPDNTIIKYINLKSNKIDSIDRNFVDNSKLTAILMENNICCKVRITDMKLVNAKLATCYDNYEAAITTEALEMNNGKVFARGKYPWIAAIMKKSGNREDYYCGGVLVSDRKVVTTARCVHKYERSAYKPMTLRDITVRLGSHDLTATSENGRVVPKISQINIHPDFKINEIKTEYDIAVIVLDKPVSMSKFVKSINLMDEGSEGRDISEGIVVSYGYKENQKLTAKSSPKELSTMFIPVEKCIHKNQATVSATADDTFCINEESPDKVCIEDIGSGLYVYYQQKYYLRGMLSSVITTNTDLCDDETVSIYTDATVYTEWINSIPTATVRSTFAPANSDFDGRPIWG